MVKINGGGKSGNGGDGETGPGGGSVSGGDSAENGDPGTISGDNRLDLPVTTDTDTDTDNGVDDVPGRAAELPPPDDGTTTDSDDDDFDAAETRARYLEKGNPQDILDLLDHYTGRNDA